MMLSQEKEDHFYNNNHNFDSTDLVPEADGLDLAIEN